MNKQSYLNCRNQSCTTYSLSSPKKMLFKLPYCQNHGRLNVEFRDNWFARKEEIWPFLDKTLQRYLDQNLSLQKILVCIFHCDVDFVLLRKWIPLLIMNMGVRSLSLIFHWNRTSTTVFPRPLVVFQSESPKKTQFELQYYPNHGSISGTAVSMLSFVTIGSPEKKNFRPFSTRLYKGVRSINISFHKSSIFFHLPLVVFQSESLVELYLTRCDLNTLNSTDNVMLNNLQTLHLHYVVIKDEIFEKIISGCPLIENLKLSQCFGLKSIKLHKHHKIKGFCCSVNVPLIIEIEYSHSLESVRIQNYCSLDWFLPHNNMHFPHLKSLHMYKVQLSAETFDNFSSFFPCLSELILKSCDGLKEFRLLSSSIKRLTIIMDTRNRIKAFIDTPNILYFEYSGHGFLPSIKFATTSNEWTSEISVWYKLKRSDNDATSWFLKLNKLLKALSQSHISLNLFSSKYEKLHINNSYGGFYKPFVVELNLSRRLSPPSDPPSDPAILNCFFQICRPRYIHIDLSGNELVEFLCKLIPKEKGSYFWLQDLEEVSIEVWEIIEDGWHWVQVTSLPEPRKPRPPVRFRLTWREQLSMSTYKSRLSAMNKQSVIRREEDDDDGSEITIDRLSQLPQPILHSILSLLSQRDAIRTCVLSKSWRYLWHGRFSVELRELDRCFASKKEFWSFLDKTLQRYLDQNLSLQKLRLDIQYEVDLPDFELLQKWIPMVIMNMGVRSLNLIFNWNSADTIVFPLPLVVFQSESLVELHLQLCNLNTLKPTDSVMLNNLQTLRLHYVDITDEIFEKLISSCPLIKNLDLFMCNGLKSIFLHKHHNIKDFDCSVDDRIIIEIEDSHPLESVRIQNCTQDWVLRYKNTHFPHLKSLYLYKVLLPPETFNYFSSFYPCLNDLALIKCDGLKEFRLLSSSIKRLTIKIKTDPRNRIKAFIDTPNILYFEYSDDGFLPSIKFTTTSNEWKSQMTLWYKLKPSDKDDTSWFLKLNKLLKSLSQSHIITLKLIRSKDEKLHINHSFGGSYKPVVVKDLIFFGCFSPPSDIPILNRFFRICHPRFGRSEHRSLGHDGGQMALCPDNFAGTAQQKTDSLSIDMERA
ncbi:hypothetical protein CASFOL_021893 [Castilleja foliolosa]|uniref:F-box domain-containing protein n=1 Tax=Castilleja foliolosa TaxID=1961234 RepID=A0ABD3D0J8_9LAMI